MKKYIFIISISLLCLISFGCSWPNADKTMCERFPDGVYKVLFDRDGNKYVVIHDSVDSYYIETFETFQSKHPDFIVKSEEKK